MTQRTCPESLIIDDLDMTPRDPERVKFWYEEMLRLWPEHFRDDGPANDEGKWND